MKALTVFKLNIFNILCFMYKSKQNLNPPIFRNIFTQGRLCGINFSQYCISNRGSNLWNKIVIPKKLSFSDSDSLQAYKRELKRFLLSVELNDLEILK